MGFGGVPGDSEGYRGVPGGFRGFPGFRVVSGFYRHA